MENISDSSETDIVIIGAGITGLFAAYELIKNNFQVTIIEKSPFVGGLSTSLNFDDCFCDIGPHFISLIEESPISKIIESFLDQNSKIDLPNIHQSYLVFFNNEILKDYPTLYQFIFKFGLSNSLKCFLSFLQSKILKKNISKFTTENYLTSTFGKYSFQNWFKPYLIHTYGTINLSEKTVTEKFLPITFQRAQNFFKNKNFISSPNDILANNCYPKFGMQQIINSIKEKIIQLNGKIILNANIVEINHTENKSIKFRHNDIEKTINCKKIVYSIPPDISIKWFNDNSIPIQDNSSLNTIIAFLIFDTEKLFDGWIINIYDPDLIFFRLSQQNFLSSDITPIGKSLLTVEIKCKSSDEIWQIDNDEILSKISSDLKKFHFKSDFISSKIIRLPSIYPILSDFSNERKRSIIEYINSFKNEYTVGTVASDTGRFASADSSENISLGGFYVAIQDVLSLVNNVVSQKMINHE